VRALLHGQGWYDLRQYRLNPPGGFDIHWTRLVDLPIAALILVLKPLIGPVWAERWACGVAPLLPLSVAMLGVGATVRRLVHPLAWPAAIALLLCASAAMTMFYPERIDHHGWQLAFLSLTVAGLADPDRARGGLLVGLSTAASLTIGLEMLPYGAGAGAIIALAWIWDRSEAVRVERYGLSLAAGSALGYALFASNANQIARCDALTPVWLSVMAAAGGLLFALARWSPAARGARLVAAGAAGVAIIAGFALVFPQCLGRPEQVSPELARAWLDNIREAKPIIAQPRDQAIIIGVLPFIGLAGALLACWRLRGTARGIAWLPVTTFTAVGCALMFWQARAAPGAQLLAVPGAVMLGVLLVGWFQRQGSPIVRVFGSVGALLLLTPFPEAWLTDHLPASKADAHTRLVNLAGGRCPSYGALTPLNRYPAQTILTFVDLGPRLITLTHHYAVAGPYHRNGDAILDVQHAFSGSDDQFRAIARRHGATLLLVCPNLAESTIYRVRHKGGFYDRLARGARPAWLEPLPLPARSPLRLFRIN